MTFEEFSEMYKAVMAFCALSPENQELILLLMDGFKYRASQRLEPQGAVEHEGAGASTGPLI